MVLTPLGEDASHLHLFPDYLSYVGAWRLFFGYVVFGAIVLLWTGRRAQLHAATQGRPDKPTPRVSHAEHPARASDVM